MSTARFGWALRCQLVRMWQDTRVERWCRAVAGSGGHGQAARGSEGVKPINAKSHVLTDIPMLAGARSNSPCRDTGAGLSCAQEAKDNLQKAVKW